MKKKSISRLGLNKSTIHNLQNDFQLQVKGGGSTTTVSTILTSSICSFDRACPVSRTGIAGECCLAQAR
jgi:hypothetical protein